MAERITHGITGNPSTDGILTPAQQEALNASQDQACEAVVDYLDHLKVAGRSGPPPLVIKPTGYGKSNVISGVLRRRHVSGNKALMSVGTKNLLLEQNRRVLQRRMEQMAHGNTVSLLPDDSGDLSLGTWSGIHAYLRRSGGGRFHFGVVDEAHNMGTDARIAAFKELGIPEMFGLTATAVRSSGKYRLPEQYGYTILEDIVSTLPECMMSGWLSPFFGIGIDTKVVLPQDVLSKNKQFSPSQLHKALREHPELFYRIGKDVAERFLSKGLKTIAVTNRVLEEAIPLAEGMRDAGFRIGIAVNSGAGRMIQERGFVTEDVLARYELPTEHPMALDAIVTIQVIGEGIDLPCTECIVWASPTRSHVRYAQILGRGARRFLGKAYCIIADYVYLIENFGYSMSFAQFFSAKDLEAVSEGVYYVGPSEKRPVLPGAYLDGAELIDVLKVAGSRKKGEGQSLSSLASKFSFGGEAALERLLTHLGIRPIRQVKREGDSRFRSYYSAEAAELVREISDTWVLVADILCELDTSDGERIVEALARNTGMEGSHASYRDDSLWIVASHVRDIASQYRGWRSKQSLAKDLKVSVGELDMAYGTVFSRAGDPERQFLDCGKERVEFFSPGFLAGLPI